MPIYEYRCDTCGNITERYFKTSQQAVDEEQSPIFRCGECRGGKPIRIPSTCGVRFTGTGFYETDYVKRKKD